MTLLARKGLYDDTCEGLGVGTARTSSGSSHCWAAGSLLEQPRLDPDGMIPTMPTSSDAEVQPRLTPLERRDALVPADKMLEYSLSLRTSVRMHAGQVGHSDYADHIAHPEATPVAILP